MSGIEDTLRQVMASHDPEAPDAPELLHALTPTPGPPGRRGKWSGLLVPLAAAACELVSGGNDNGLEEDRSGDHADDHRFSSQRSNMSLL